MKQFFATLMRKFGLQSHWWKIKARIPWFWDSLVANSAEDRIFTVLQAEFGDIKINGWAEAGVSRGDLYIATFRAIRRHNGEYKAPIGYGFDSFEGLPENDEGWGKGQYASSLSATKLHIRKAHVPEHAIVFYKGWFEDTMNEAAADDITENLGLLRLISLDCDLDSSTETAINFFSQLISEVEKTVIICDDWASGGRDETDCGQAAAFLRWYDTVADKYCMHMKGGYNANSRIIILEPRDAQVRLILRD